MSDAYVRRYFAGYLLIALIVKLLNRAWRHLHPKNKDEGMPSSKGATVSYIASVTLNQYKINNMTKAIIFSISAILLTIEFVYNHNTLQQILAGSIIGITIGYLVMYGI